MGWLFTSGDGEWAYERHYNRHRPIAHETVGPHNHRAPLPHPEISIRSARNAGRYSTA